MNMIDDYIGSPLDSRVIAALIDPAAYQPKVVGVSPTVPSGQTIAGAIHSLGADIVVGSGYVETFYPPTPVGLLIVDSVLISPLNKVTTSLTGVVGVEGGTLFLRKHDEPLADHISSAFQVGPCLVEHGRNAIKANEPKRVSPATRAFVGVRSDGLIVTGVTRQPVHLFHLAEYLVKSADSGGLGCVNAVNLAGGGSDGLAVRSRDSVMVFGNVHRRQASVLCFVRRE